MLLPCHNVGASQALAKDRLVRTPNCKRRSVTRWSVSLAMPRRFVIEKSADLGVVHDYVHALDEISGAKRLLNKNECLSDLA